MTKYILVTFALIMIMPSSIQEVMNRADIVEVIEQFVRLKRRGSNYIANCPFHNEKTPSFSVSAAKGIFKCFGCGKAGNVINFVQEHEKISYPEAIKWLASFYKIELEETAVTEEQSKVIQQEELLRTFNEFAAQYFEHCLTSTNEGELIGLSYFKERNFRQDIIEKFRLGYCPGEGALFYQEAHSKGFDTDVMQKSGIVKQGSYGFYDVYKGRVIFPIQSMTGRVLGFGARILKSNDRAPKYINTPENELYNKSKILYGIFQSRKSIAKLDECYLVEGYTDVISLHQGGVENVLASSGTSLTEDQLRLIGRITKNLTIIYDGDSAGIKAALRGLDMALSQSFNVKLTLLPDGQDPDSYIQSVGESSFRSYIEENKRDIIGFRLELGIKEAENDPHKKSKLVNEIAESISKINKAEDFSLQDVYIKQAAQELHIEEEGLIHLVNKYTRNRIEQEKRENTLKYATQEDVESAAATQTNTSEPIVQSTVLNDELQEWQLIRVLLLYGQNEIEDFDNVAQLIRQRIDPTMIETENVKKFYDIYFNEYDKINIAPNISYFTNNVDKYIQSQSISLIQEKNEISPNWENVYRINLINAKDNYKNDVESSLIYFELKKIKMLLKEVREETENAKSENEQIKLMQQFLLLKKEEKEILLKIGTVIVK